VIPVGKKHEEKEKQDNRSRKRSRKMTEIKKVQEDDRNKKEAERCWVK